MEELPSIQPPPNHKCAYTVFAEADLVRHSLPHCLAAMDTWCRTYDPNMADFLPAEMGLHRCNVCILAFSPTHDGMGRNRVQKAQGPNFLADYHYSPGNFDHDLGVSRVVAGLNARRREEGGDHLQHLIKPKIPDGLQFAPQEGSLEWCFLCGVPLKEGSETFMGYRKHINAKRHKKKLRRLANNHPAPVAPQGAEEAEDVAVVEEELEGDEEFEDAVAEVQGANPPALAPVHTEAQEVGELSAERFFFEPYVLDSGQKLSTYIGGSLAKKGALFYPPLAAWSSFTLVFFPFSFPFPSSRGDH